MEPNNGFGLKLIFRDRDVSDDVTMEVRARVGPGHNYTIIFISDLYTRLIKNLGHVSRVRSCDDQSPGPSWGEENHFICRFCHGRFC